MNSPVSDRLAIGAVLLAAGAGERMGRRPKCLLELDGEPLIQRTLLALSQVGVAEVVVVLGHHADRVQRAIENIDVTVVRHPSPDEGPVSTQRLGLGSLTRELDAVMMVLADQPLVDAADLTALIAAWRQRPDGMAVVYPEIDGVRGNPVVISAEVRLQILAADSTMGCRHWQQQHRSRVMPFVTDNRHYLIDIDTPDDMARFKQETGMELRWPAGE